MSQVPWWGVPVVAGLFALGGVLATQLVAVRLDRLRAKRDDSRRWLADRRRIYASLLATAEEIYERLKDDWATERDVSAYREEISSLRSLCLEIHLMSGQDVNAAAWEIADKFYEAIRLVEPRTKVALEDWKRDYTDAVHRFVLAARADLDADAGK